MDANRQQAQSPNFDWYDALDDFRRRTDVRPQTKRAFECIWRWANGRAGELKGFTVSELASVLACDPRTARDVFEELLQSYSRKGVQYDGVWLVDVILNEGGIMRLYVYDPRVDIQHRKREADPQLMLPFVEAPAEASGISAQESPTAPHLRVIGSGNPVQESPTPSGISAQESPSQRWQNGGDTYTSLVINTSKNPPPSSASASEPDEGWEEVEEVLRATGMACWSQALADARRRALPPLEVLALVEHWHEHRPAWDVGALFRRLQNHSEGGEVASGWPVKSERYQQLQSHAHRRQQAMQREAEAAREKQRLANEATESKRLESVYGARLDAMPRNQLDGLARLALQGFLLAKFQSDGCASPGLVREALITYLAKHDRESHGEREEPG